MKTDMITPIKGIALDIPAESLLQMQARYNMFATRDAMSLNLNIPPFSRFCL